MDEINIVEENGNVRISEEVVAIIASLAASDVPGVCGMAGGGIASGWVDMLSKKNTTRGVKVDIKDNDVTIDLHIIVQYGVRIPEVAWEIQEKVKKTVETMTGLNAVKVNIHIDSISFEKENSTQKAQEPEKEDGSKETGDAESEEEPR